MRYAQETTIAETARTHGLSLRTLRFYEQQDLLHPRREGNVRYYSPRDMIKIALIQKGKRLGFSLRQIARLITSDHSGPASPKPAEVMVISQEVAASQLVILKRESLILKEAIVELETYSRNGSFAASH